MAVLAVSAPGVAEPAPTPPSGVTAIALDGKVSLAWPAVTGASGYRVYRGTSAATATTLVGSPTGASFVDTTAANGTTYFYAVTARDGTGESAKSASLAQAKPLARSCATGNAVVVENCTPGSTGWKLTNAGRAYDNGIEGFATATSVNAGSSVDLKVNTGPTGANAPYHIDIYRMGYYGGSQGRLVSTLPGLRGVSQQGCDGPDTSTGLVDCGDWSTTTTLSTTADWPTGVYWLHLVRDDNGADNAILLVVRRDGHAGDVLYTLPTATYQAYNPYGGKSLYDFNSNGATTVSGTTRAVKVSYDRPYAQTYNGANDFFPYADQSNVAFLERNGYDLDYTTSTDLHANGAQVASHKAFVSPAHDEYWSAPMRSAVTAARDSGTGLFWLGSNQVYWRIRFESSPTTGAANRVEACYKTTQSGATDPVSPTGTWRDPSGANAPENGLVGSMYVGDNDNRGFPLVVSAAQGRTRVWRHTPLASMTGASTSLGASLVGWEWNDRVANGFEPAGTQAFTGSPVDGELIQGNGRSYVPGNATASGTLYRAASGAWVVSTGTNFWSRGLANNGFGSGELDTNVQQATVNVLADMNAKPATPAAGLVQDQAGAPVLTSTSPAAGATGVPIGATVKATFDRALDPATVTAQTVTLTPSGGAAVAATVTYDDATQSVTVKPTAALDAFQSYTLRLKGGTGGVASWSAPLAADATSAFTTGAGTPPQVASTSPADGATGVSAATAVKATFDRAMDPATLTTANVTLRSAAGVAVAGAVAYDATSRTVTLTPSGALDPTTQYVATVKAAAKASDGTAMNGDVSWTFTTAAALQVTSRTPAPLATGVAPRALVRATFSRALDPATVTTTSLRLATSDGTSVPASVSYDASSTSATLTPTSALALATTYTATVTTAVTAADGTPLSSAVTWSFSTAMTAPTAPTVTVTTPADAATGVGTDTAVSATFDRALDPASVTGQSVVLKDAAGTAVSATVSYDASTTTARLTPTAVLAPGKAYTAQLTTAIRAADGTPMANAVSFGFTTADCPCSLMGTSTPAVNEDVRDGRAGTGPFSYELGTKITVDKTMSLVALRFYRHALETGTHVGRVWSSTGTQLAAVTYQGETASGWQRQALDSPITLQAGQTYTVSVGLNTRYVATEYGLQSALDNGPLHSVVGANGVYGASAGTFPTASWHNSNYFVDAVVKNPGSATVPQVTARTPVSGATQVDTATKVTATFSTALSPSSVNASTFTLKSAAGTAVPATVAYDGPTRTATLTASSALAGGTAYTATLTTGVRADDETPMAAPVSWGFSTTTATAPTVTGVSPADAATQVAVGTTVQATFSASVDPATVTPQTFTLTGPAGAVPAAVAYDDATRTATLTPTSALSPSASYTATVGTGVKGTNGKALGAARTWGFTTSACPCSLMAALTPATTGLPVRDGRSGAGPFTYEMGTKVQVAQAVRLTAVRFYKDAAETGTHVGRVWTAGGQPLASVTFTGETASGWQQATLATPVDLSAGASYVVSVGLNTTFVMTNGGLRSGFVSGPLSSVADGRNGVFADAAGVFPTGSYNASNYFVDAVVR